MAGIENNKASNVSVPTTLEDLEATIAGIRTRVDEITKATAQKVKEAQEAATKASTPGGVLDLNPIPSLDMTPRFGNTVSQENIEDMEAGAKPYNALGAIDSTFARTNNLAVSTEVPESLQTPGFFGSKDETPTNWQEVYQQLQLQQIQAQSTQQPFDSRALLEEQYQAWGVVETFEELKSLQTQSLSIRKELDSLRLDERRELDRLDANLQGRLTGIANRQKNQIIEGYDRRRADLSAELSSYAAEGAMLQGNITMAKNFAENIVSAATYDEELKFKKMDAIYTLQMDFVEQLRDDERAVLDYERDSAEDALKIATVEREQIVKWGTSSTTAPALYGVNMGTISFEDASNRVRDYLAVKGLTDPTPKPSDFVSPTKFNIEAGLVGLSKQEALDIWREDTPPSWFVKKEEKKAQASLPKNQIQQLWNDFSRGVKAKAEKEAATGGDSDFDKEFDSY